MKKGIIILILISNFAVFSQNSESERILNKGKLLYRLKKASWYSTDLFLANYPTKKDSIGGYLSYEKNNKIYSIFFNKFDNNKVIIRYEFDSIPKAKALAFELNKNATELEKELITIRQDTRKKVIANKDDFFKFYKKTAYNFIPLITKNKKQVYIITGSQVNGNIIIGNDYILTYDKKNRFIKKEKLHNSLLLFPYKNEKNPTITTIHSHIITDYITETDICTLLLYKNFVEWKKHIVISKKEVSIFNLENETLFIIKRKVWEKMNNSNKSHK